MNYLIQSDGDQPITCGAQYLCERYIRKIFMLITECKNTPIYMNFPLEMPSGDYFILITDGEHQLKLNESMSFSLYKVVEKETGWLRSIKVKEPKFVKGITVKAVDVFDRKEFGRLHLL